MAEPGNKGCCKKCEDEEVCCGDGGCESCPCCCAGWCIFGADEEDMKLNASAEDWDIWREMKDMYERNLWG